MCFSPQKLGYLKLAMINHNERRKHLENSYQNKLEYNTY